MLLLAQLTGTPNSRQAAQAYAEAGWLSECHHSLAWTHPPAWWSWLPLRWRASLSKRVYPEIPASTLRRHPWVEATLRTQASPRAANRRFDLAIARRLADPRGGWRAVHGYFDTALHSFRLARRRGVRTIYELPTPYWRAVAQWLEPERHRRPEWAPTLPSPASLEAAGPQRDEELQLADLVVVPSTLVQDSLQWAPAFKAPVVVVPYGCPEPQLFSPPPTPHSPLRLLFAGTLSQSKGLADVIDALLPLGDRVVLTVAGSAPGTLPGPLDQWLPSVRLLGQLPHARLQDEMRQHDVLLLPTLYEGLALTLLEAMSAGLAVVTTPRSGLGDGIEPGLQAVLVPPGQPTAIREAIESLLTHPQRLRDLQEAARSWAASHPWSGYRQQLRTTVAPLLS